MKLPCRYNAYDSQTLKCALAQSGRGDNALAHLHVCTAHTHTMCTVLRKCDLITWHCDDVDAVRSTEETLCSDTSHLYQCCSRDLSETSVLPTTEAIESNDLNIEN